MRRNFFHLLLIVVTFYGTTHNVAAQTPSETPAPKHIVVTNLNETGPGSLYQAFTDATPGSKITFADGLSGAIKSNTKENYSGNPNPKIMPPIPKDITVYAAESRPIILERMFFYEVSITFQNIIFMFSNIELYKSESIAKFENCLFLSLSRVSASDGTLNIYDSEFFDTQVSASSKANLLIERSLFRGPYSRVSGTSERIGSHKIINTTFYDNEISIRGGGFEIINSTIQARELAFTKGLSTLPNKLKNTILARVPISNRAELTLEDVSPCSVALGITTPIEDGGGNLQPLQSTCHDTIPKGDLKLGVLKNNGGKVMSIELLPGSSAIGAGNPAVCASPEVKNQDQRGFTLVGKGQVPTRCDSGAFQTTAVFDPSENR
jgi:hypothetical protein